MQFEQATQKTRGKWIKVGGALIELRPPGLYSLNMMMRQANLIHEMSTGEYGGVLPTSHGVKILRKLAETYVIDPSTVAKFKFTSLLSVCQQGNEFITETSSGGEGGNPDLGEFVNSLRSTFGGSVAEWWDTPMFVIDAATGSGDSDSGGESTALDFLLAMNEFGIGVS